MASLSLPCISVSDRVDIQLDVDLSELEGDIETAIEDAIRDDIDTCEIGNNVLDEFENDELRQERVINAFIHLFEVNPSLRDAFVAALNLEVVA